MNFYDVYEKVRLDEMKVNPSSFAYAIKSTFEKSLPILSSDFLPNDFLKKLSKSVVAALVRIDQITTKGEGLILITDRGILRRGAISLNIRSFVDMGVEHCTTYANDFSLKKTSLKDHEKVFVQTFLDSSFMNKNAIVSWKVIFRDHLTAELEVLPGIALGLDDRSF